VVAQMLDYAANATKYWPEGRIQAQFEDRCRSAGQSPDVVIEALCEGDVDIDDYWHSVTENLRNGRVRLLFVLDRLPGELRRIVEFLNEQMAQTEVLAVEIPQFVGRGLRSLVPRVHGLVEPETKRGTAGPRRADPWDMKSFEKDIIAKAGKDAAAIAHKIHDWAVQRGMEISWGRGRSYGSFAPYIRRGDRTYRPLIIYSNGTVAIRLSWLKDAPPFDSLERRRELASQLSRVTTFSFSESDLERTEPSFSLSALADADDLNALDEAIDWLEQTIAPV
jgi:hypothetical protein